MRLLFHVPLTLAGGSALTGVYQIITDGSFDSSVTRAPFDGLFMSVKDVNFSALGDAYFGFFGGGGAISTANVEHAFKATSGGWLIIENGAALTPVFRPIATATNYDLAITYDANLFAHYWIRATAEDWRRVWISTYAATDPTVFAEQFADGGTYTASTERFGYLGTGLLAPSVEHAGSVPAATTGNAPDGDMLWRYTATTRPSAGSILLNLRQQDASNYWQNEIVGSNGNHLLDEVVAASSTNRISAAAAVTNGEKITARLIGSQATVYSSNAQDGQYTPARNFLRALGYDLNSLGTGGVVNDLRGFKAYARDEAGLGSELLVDGDMEAVGVGAWTAEALAVVTKETTSPHGGTQLIRVAYGGLDSPRVLQNILTIGKYYWITGYARSDGTVVPNIVADGAFVWSGTNSTSWQSFDIFVTPTASITVKLQPQTFGSGYAEFDDVSIKEVTFADDALGTLLEGVVA